MSKDDRKTSKLSIAGLIVAVAAPCLFFFFVIVIKCLDKYLDTILVCLVFSFLILPFAALPLSIAGVIISKKKNKKGLIPGIVGLILSVVEIALVISSIAAYLLSETAPGHSLDIVPPHVGISAGIETDDLTGPWFELG